MRSKPLFLAALLFTLCGSGQSTSVEARTQLGAGLDLSIKTCADFSVSESHLDAAYHVVTKGYKTVPNQAQPVAQVAGVENPEKMQEFMSWYANGGRMEMMLAGEMCRMGIWEKSGQGEATIAGYLIATERARTAEFFADKLMKQCTGKELK
jgi:hypothetical protein